MTETVRRYVQQHGIPAELPGLSPAKYDGVTELWVDEVEASDRYFGPDYMAIVRPDEHSIPDLHECDFITSEEHMVVG